MQLRPYQQKAKTATYQAWQAGLLNVLVVKPTGAGKTVTMGSIIRDHDGAVCAIAHRQELVSQISLALAREGVKHKIIGPKSVVKLVVNLHMSELGRSFYDPNASCAVVGVDTIIRREKELSYWINSVTLWVIDEAHHVLKDNKWGKAAQMFPNAKGLGVTATPLRADGKGLGRDFDGLFDTMIEGPTMRDLINGGFLTDYRIFAPPNDIDLSQVNTSKTTGDFSRDKLIKAVRKSHVIGDVVGHYLRIAPNKLGITFATDVKTATDIAEQFNRQGVPAEVVSAKTPDADRIAVLRRFKRREVLQLVNVDLFGEGFDLPAIEVVSMARPTQSYGLYVQIFGRGLRLLEGKEHAIIIDHVGNVVRHGLPDAPRAWSLGRRERSTSISKDDAIPVKACPSCTAVYERIHAECPFCGFKPQPMARSGPEQVDGDLCELSPAVLAQMRVEVNRVDMSPDAYRAELAAKHVPPIGQMANVKRHVKRQEAQTELRAAIAWWAGYQRAAGQKDSESYRRFYFKFGIDVISAQALGAKAALDLALKINTHLGEMSCRLIK